MAAFSVSRGSGYQCEFVGGVSEEFMCGLCRHVAREPHVTGCCGKTVCEGCITPVLGGRERCPMCECRASEFSSASSADRRHGILALGVHCTMKDRGCEWTGKLEGLEAHLDVNTGDCEYVDVECSNPFCSEHFQKYDLSSHLSYFCPKREYTCKFCGFKATYSVVHDEHHPQCQSYPVSCPNACGEQAIKRSNLDVHLLECPLVEVECEFSYAGCEMRVPRQDLERHMEDGAPQHLSLLSAKIKEMKECQEKIQKETEENTAKIRELQKHAQICSNYSPTIQLPAFAHRRKTGGWWQSPPLYTHPAGYKFCIAVNAQGHKGAAGTHISVSMDALKGQFDCQLLWPAKATVTLQLLNRERDEGHLTVTRKFGWPRPSKSTYIGFFGEKFISHSELSQFNPDKWTRYLVNDIIFFRVKVEMD